MKTGPKPMPIKDRLLRHRDIDPQTGCWNWTAARIYNGYGVTGVGSRTTGRGQYLVHRVAGWVFKGWDLDSPLLTCHHCDNKRCFNPDHLFQGTRSDNAQDMIRKGKGPHNHVPRKLTREIVVRIRGIKFNSGRRNRDIGREFGITGGTVSKLVKRRLWAHV